MSIKLNQANPRKSINYCKNNECSRCCNCCGAVLPLSKDEILKMQSLYKNKKEIKELVDDNCSMTYGPDGKPDKVFLMCPFVDVKNHRCSIYEDRPKICRLYRCDKDNDKAVRECEAISFINSSDYATKVTKERLGALSSFFKDSFNIEELLKAGDRMSGVITTHLLLGKPLLHNTYCLLFFRDDIIKRTLKLEKKLRISQKEAFERTINEFAYTLNLEPNSFSEAYELFKQSF